VITVGIDVSALAQTRAGAARYIAGLTRALEEDGSVVLRRYALEGGGRAAAVLRDAAWYPAALPRVAVRDGVDLLHCPTFRAPFRTRVPLVVTFHDVAVLRHPYVFNRWSRTYGAAALPRVARAAAALLADSEFTRRELVDLLGMPEERVHVAQLGVGSPFGPDGPAASGDYVLAVSTLEPRKNLVRLVEGFSLARLEGLELRIAGASGWGDVRLSGERVRWLGEVSDDELAALYRGARCAAYVSLYEGFGLPVLEAMACGTAVVTSRAPALLEVGADVAIAKDGLDPAAIAAGLEEAAARRDELGARGIDRARQFGWERAARTTLDVYRSVLM
jgi:glycosyltransferase involved in cell wall biosynthesis